MPQPAKGGKRKGRNKAQEEQKQEPEPIKKINQQYQLYLKEARAITSKAYNPQNLFSQISSHYELYQMYEQQDAQELLRCLLGNPQRGREIN